MGRRDPEVLYAEIAEACRDIATYIEPLDAQMFEALPEGDSRTSRAVKNALSEIGEAIKSLPDEVCASHPEVDWRGLAGLRDIVAHQYFRLDTQRLWLTLVDDLPKLVSAIEAELPSPPAP